MTSLDRISPLGLDKNVEVEFLQDENPNFFADTCSLFLRVPTMHKTITQFKEKLMRVIITWDMVHCNTD